MEDKHVKTATEQEQIRHSVHELRNGMNALLMNAAVLGSRADDVSESLRPFVAAIARAGKACSEELTRLFALIDARKA